MEDAKFKITPEFVIDMIVRRRWIIMVPLSLALVVGICLAVFLPKVYEAQTMILVESQRVPQNYVQSIVTEDTAQRINTISQQILSRTNLEKIIRDFGLFSGPEYEGMFIEDKVASLSKQISVDVITDQRRATEAFTITFKSTDPEKVMRVANGLATYFIDENLKARESQAIGTSSFLESELETMRVRLEQVEEQIKEYRKNNMGELPEQLQSNLAILTRLQENLSSRQQNLRDARARLADLRAQTTSREPSVVVIGGDQRPREGVASLEELKDQLEAMEARYTAKHPDIQRLKRQIADLETRAGQTGGNGTTQRIPAELRQQIADANLEIQIAEAEIEELRNQINSYQGRIENIPKREQELLTLRRDYDNIQATYESLLNRKLEADIAVNMERKQKGEQFRILDPARVPQRPVEPDLKKLFLMILAVGLGIGCGIAFLMEFLKPAHRWPDEIEERYEMPVLAMIPQMMQPRQVFLKKLDITASVAYSVLILGLIGTFGFMSVKGPEFAVEVLKRLTGS